MKNSMKDIADYVRRFQAAPAMELYQEWEQGNNYALQYREVFNEGLLKHCFIEALIKERVIMEKRDVLDFLLWKGIEYKYVERFYETFMKRPQ